MNKLLIKGARIINPVQNMDTVGDILLQNGKIAAVGGKITCEAAQIIDAQGLIAAPGLVDMHVHLRDPGFTYKEDIISGCKAAAAGGVTSLLAMPNTNPVTDTPETVSSILEKAQNANAHVYVAGAITQGLKSEQLCDLAALKNAGAIALSDDGKPVENTALMAQAMMQAPKLNLKIVSHCEDLSLAKAGFPYAAEDCGTAREIALASAFDVPVHICHVSTAASAALIRDAKLRGVQVTAETAPHYLMLTEKELQRHDADYRMNPPLRTEEDRLAIIEAVMDGTIDAIATDHAPHSAEEKADFVTAPNGSIGMETSLAVGITALVKDGCLDLSQLIERMSVNPAYILGINAGTLNVGAPADVVLFDENEEWTVDETKLHGKSRNTPFKGLTLTGKVKMTICRGEIVYTDM
jgi:dihydroorotase